MIDEVKSGISDFSTEEITKLVEAAALRKLKAKCRMRAFQELSVIYAKEFKELLKEEYKKEKVE